MKNAINRIPTWVLLVVLFGLMGVLWLGIATRDGGPTSPLADGDEPTTSAPTDGAATSSDDASTAEQDSTTGDDEATPGAGGPAAEAGSDDDSPRADRSEPAVSGDAGDLDDGRAASDDDTDRQPAGSQPAVVTTVPPEGLEAPDTVASDARDADEAEQFEEQEAERQADLGAVEDDEVTVDQPAVGDLEADAEALADAQRDEYFERQLEELEP